MRQALKLSMESRPPARTYRVEPREGQTSYTVTVSQEFLDDHSEDEINTLLGRSDVLGIVRTVRTAGGRVLLTNNGIHIEHV